MIPGAAENTGSFWRRLSPGIVSSQSSGALSTSVSRTITILDTTSASFPALSDSEYVTVYSPGTCVSSPPSSTYIFSVMSPSRLSIPETPDIRSTVLPFFITTTFSSSLILMRGLPVSGETDVSGEVTEISSMSSEVRYSLMSAHDVKTTEKTRIISVAEKNNLDILNERYLFHFCC